MCIIWTAIAKKLGVLKLHCISWYVRIYRSHISFSTFCFLIDREWHCTFTHYVTLIVPGFGSWQTRCPKPVLQLNLKKRRIIDLIHDDSTRSWSKMTTTQNLDFVLENLVGGSGLYQWRTYMFMFPFELVSGVTLLLHLFSAYTPPHRYDKFFSTVYKTGTNCRCKPIISINW